ncbi:hypothetical protein HYH03_010760 [Edaphochlamys debaryana]|uniref:BTB domain-containing protein n=1 Tax=Edaphochlamys debaryana TaxID=47281 RepID=A0A836BWC8_9CHLO|nr:hypothetical protein HYH03_010760 [Edaphochlamys debaryana]|eukprot:KAG2490842.1 hypothetical protein HYH03_010760 [Edaphochlamys debaryana]
MAPTLGSPATGPLFGASPAAPTFGSPPAAPGFGSPPAAPSFGSPSGPPNFGSPPKPVTFGAAAAAAGSAASPPTFGAATNISSTTPSSVPGVSPSAVAPHSPSPRPNAAAALCPFLLGVPPGLMSMTNASTPAAPQPLEPFTSLPVPHRRLARPGTGPVRGIITRPRAGASGCGGGSSGVGARAKGQDGSGGGGVVETLGVTRAGRLLPLWADRGSPAEQCADSEGPESKGLLRAEGSSGAAAAAAPVYDSAGASTYYISQSVQAMYDGTAVYRLAHDGSVTLVAGHPTATGTADGAGTSARFTNATHLAADPAAGALYLADGLSLRRLALPAALRADPWAGGSGDEDSDEEEEGVLGAVEEGSEGEGDGQRGAGKGDKARKAGAEAEVVVDTLPARLPGRGCRGLMHVPPGSGVGSGGQGPGGSLVVATADALYLLPLPLPSGPAAPGPAAERGSAAGEGPRDEGQDAGGAAGAVGFTAASGSGTASGSGPDQLRLLAGGGPKADPSRDAGPAGACGSGASDSSSGGAPGSSSAGSGGVAAGFKGITGIALDGQGGLWVTDQSAPGRTALWRVGLADGSARVEVEALGAAYGSPAVLPSGYLALCGLTTDEVLLLDLGLAPPAALVATLAAATRTAAALQASRSLSAPRPPPDRVAGRSLAEDMGALLDRQPDGTSDVALIVGDRAFHAHMAVLRARMPGLMKMVAAAVAAEEGDGARAGAGAGSSTGAAAQAATPRRLPHGPQLVVPDVDPDLFGHVLRWAYTGSTGELPVAQLRPLVDLAMQLGLERLQRLAAAQLLAAVEPGEAVELLLWAQRGARPLEAVLEGAQRWFLDNQAQVMEAAPESVLGLFRTNPDLALQLHRSLVQRVYAL